MSTPDLRQALRARFSLPEWVLMEEVRDAAGFDGKRSADGIAMNMWPSRGLEIWGFELKASRSDWLRELKNPAKAEAIGAFCDRWFIVALPGLVKVDELPVTWGLMELRGRTLTTVREARKNESPRPLERTFVAAMMRRCGEHDQAMLQHQAMLAADSVRRQEKERADQEVELRTRRLVDLQKKLQAIKDQTGIDLAHHAFSDQRVTAALKFALAADDLTASYSGLESLRRSLVASIKTIDAAVPLLPRPEKVGT